MTDHDITLYAHKFRSRAERVLWTLEELGFDYTLKRIDVAAGDLRDPAFLRLNPAGKIPVLTHGERALTESVAIMEYLAALMPEAGLLPDGADEQYAYSRLMHFIVSEIEAYLWTGDQAGRLKAYYPWPDGTEAFANQMATKNLRALRHYLAGDGTGFACCGRLTLIDILLAQILSWAENSGLELHETLRAHLRMMQARPACPENMRAD